MPQVVYPELTIVWPKEQDSPMAWLTVSTVPASVGESKVKFFVSGKFEDRLNIRRIQDALRTMGYEITEDWTYHEYSDKGYPVDYAISDVKGIFRSDIYVGRFVADYNYKGSLVELGIALCNGNLCMIIGHAIDDCIFVDYPLIRQFEDDEEFLNNIKFYVSGEG
ncbi:MAG: hypothetical protein V1709_09685 [Planctomycetota bacterium]